MAVVLGLFLFGACNQAEQKTVTKAFIYERQELQDGKIMLSYRFKAPDTFMQDTAIVENLSIPQDSVTVQYDREDPRDSRLLLASAKWV